MGQLIKLYDYVSRYEFDIYKYPSRFIRLKHKQWDNLKSLWENESWPSHDSRFGEYDNSGEQAVKNGLWNKLKSLVTNKNEIEIEELPNEEKNDTLDELDVSGFFKNQKFLMQVPQSLEQLKHSFLDEIFNVQMIWASSTFSQQSYVDSSFFRDENLKYFIQRFPDTFLFLYNPIFKFKNAPIECETICITPTEVLCISFLEEEEGASFIVSDDRFWEKRYNNEKRKILNPLISLKRTETIVHQLFKINEVDLPTKKLIITRNGYLDNPSYSFGLEMIDRRNYQDWFQSVRSLRSPIKHNQLRAAKALLDFCQSNAVTRSEWMK